VEFQGAQDLEQELPILSVTNEPGVYSFSGGGGHKLILLGGPVAPLTPMKLAEILLLHVKLKFFLLALCISRNVAG